MIIKIQYLGDGVYAEFDGFQIWLFTHDGFKETNRIALEPSVLEILNTYEKYIREEAQHEENRDPAEEKVDAIIEEKDAQRRYEE